MFGVVSGGGRAFLPGPQPQAAGRCAPGTDWKVRPPEMRYHRSPHGCQEQIDVFLAQAEATTIAAVENGGEFLLACLQLQNTGFDGIFRDEFVDEDGLVLTDAVGAVGGLAFNGRVPPGIVMNHGVGGGQVEADASGLEADQEERDIALLKTMIMSSLFFLCNQRQTSKVQCAAANDNRQADGAD